MRYLIPAALLAGGFAWLSLDEPEKSARRIIEAPAGHVLVAKDKKGFLWVELFTDWNECRKCHQDRWTQASPVSLTPMRLEYVRGKELFTENPGHAR